MISVLLAVVSQWIWLPGDFEIYVAQEVQERRLEWGGVTPVMWPQYHHYPIVQFSHTITLKEDEDMEIWIDGEGSYDISSVGTGNIVGGHMKFHLRSGKNRFVFKIVNSKRVPSILIKGKTFGSNADWYCCHDGIWEDRTHVDTWEQFDAPDKRPSDFALATEPMEAVSSEKTEKGGLLVDFGKETMGFPIFRDIRGNGKVKVIYGESRSEARFDGLGDDFPGQKNTSADVWEILELKEAKEYKLPKSRAYRYINIVPLDKGVSVGSVGMLYEYNPIPIRGAFRCSDDLINRIWDVGAYTLHLTEREFLLDGIKRDRWVWCGDAYQSCLMNYYVFGDKKVVSRTLWALRGKDPVWRHINTIVDYTFYWFNIVGDYYLFTSDAELLKLIYPRMVTLMDFVEKRMRKDGFYERQPGDWVFIDWAPDDLDNGSGPVAAEQMLLARAYMAMAKAAEFVGEKKASVEYAQKGENLKARIKPLYWNAEKGGLVHTLDHDLKQREQFTRYANIFGVLYGYFTPEERDIVMKKCIRNPQVMMIQTPYMRFYELEAQCALGMQEEVLKEIKSYWGGMLKLGATSFWELYNPTESGDQHYAMYGRRFGKSLCHAWGASPAYLLGKYYLGVTPTSPGFKTYEVNPNLGGLDWIEGDVPTPWGHIHVRADRNGHQVTEVRD